jgi:hypothetical protein
MHPRASTLIGELGLSSHPEGGFFREIYRSASLVRPADAAATRTAVTTIYFLLVRGQHSRWHRVRSDELWHFYEGDALELLLGSPDLERVERLTLSAPLGSGRAVQVAPAGWWQAARPLGDFSLVGCSVAPGFEYADFEFLRDDPSRSAALGRVARELAPLI